VTDKDRRALRNGVRLAQDLGRQRALSTFIDGEIGPDVAKITDGELDAHVRATAQTAHHPRGTCRMGLSPDDGAVVNP
jgi:4-pyridoxate dehydrogenase